MDNLNFQPTCSQEPKYLKGFSAKTIGALRPLNDDLHATHIRYFKFTKTLPLPPPKILMAHF